MRHLALLSAALFALSFTSFVRADDSKEVSLQGKLECAHCALHEGDKCQDVLMVKDGDKEVRYEVELKGDLKSKHVCSGSKNVKITGTLTEKDGKNILTAEKVEEIKA